MTKKVEDTTHAYSIFLLKEEFSAENALGVDHGLIEAANPTNLPKGSKLFVLVAGLRQPWWREYFGIQEDMGQVSKGALLFVPVSDRWFALAFGNVHHHLDDYAYEYDFGLKVTLNSLDPKELKSADSVQPGGAKRRRTQVPKSTELTYLDFDGNSEIIRSLTGKVKVEFRELFKNATGSASLRVSMKLKSEDIPPTCKKLLDLYDKDDYKSLFPNIQNIAPINDPSVRDVLNERLISGIQNKSADLALAVPEVVDYRENSCCLFRSDDAESDVYPDISLEGFYSFFEAYFDLKTCSLDDIKSVRMILTDADGRGVSGFGLMRCFIYEFQDEDENALFHFCDGQWFRVDDGFVSSLSAYLDAICEPSTLCPYNHDKVEDGKPTYSEGEYNKGVEAWDNKYICLDTDNVAPKGETQIEPCDLMTVDKDDASRSGFRAEFIHVKISTRSASLSHLFNQGSNSISLVKREAASWEKLTNLIKSKLNGRDEAMYLEPVRNRDFSVTYAIVTHKDPDKKSENLPLFSKISLKKSAQELDSMEVPVRLVFVPDHSPKKEGHQKYDEVEVEVCQTPDGKSEVRVVVDGQPDAAAVVTRCAAEVRGAAVGARFLICVRKAEDGKFTSFHKWPILGPL